jgi:hypothetical protein
VGSILSVLPSMPLEDWLLRGRAAELTSIYVQDTKYQDCANPCEKCGSPLVEALKHIPPLSRAYNRAAYIFFCNSCKVTWPNVYRWVDWE